jgi:hypothetical protein
MLCRCLGLYCLVSVIQERIFSEALSRLKIARLKIVEGRELASDTYMVDI